MKYKEKSNINQFYFVSPGNDYINEIFYDLTKVDNLTYFSTPLRKSCKLTKLLHHIHFSFRLNKKINLPFQSIWKKKYALSQVKFDDEKRHCVIFTDVSACRTDIKYLESLHNRQNIILVMTLTNVVNSKERLITSRLKYFKYIFSWDKGDVEKYNFIYIPDSLSSPREDIFSEDAYSDCLFVGVSKGRLGILQDIYTKVTRAGGIADFYITGVKKKDQNVRGIHYNKTLPYSVVQRKNRATNCMIEIIASNQTGNTTRMLEAIIGNKKIITTNELIKTEKYYNPKYMRVFSTLSDDDVSFIMRKEDVDYHYSGEYSPIQIIEQIIKRDKLD